MIEFHEALARAADSISGAYFLEKHVNLSFMQNLTY